MSFTSPVSIKANRRGISPLIAKFIASARTEASDRIPFGGAAVLGLGALVVMAAPEPARADQLISDDLVVNGSLCVGLDCVNGESFGFDTLRLKENNLRIRAQDTSSSASFPSNDWQITFNDTSNGGANKFSIDDIDGSRTPFTIEAGTRNHQLYVDSAGRVGFGTSNPVTDLHVTQGNTPTLRLEQDGSSGFTAQTWDVAGNETNFFVRDNTGGSQLPLRIAPGADTNSLSISSTNNIGIGIQNAAAALHVNRGDGSARLVVENTGASGTAVREMLKLINPGGSYITMENTDTTQSWYFTHENNAPHRLLLTHSDGGVQMALSRTGDLKLMGTLTTGSNTAYPDYVFEEGYELMPLSEVARFIADNGHLPRVASAAEVGRNGINITELQLSLLEKVEELTLYTLDQEERAEAQTRTIADLTATVATLNTRLSALED